jgi:aminoglycoside 3-N-acetyltransferase
MFDMKNLTGFKEFCVRYTYYRTPLNMAAKFNYSRKKAKKNKVDFDDLKSITQKLGVKSGDSLIIHSALSLFNCSAVDLISFFQDILGPKGNLLMPTHPRLEENNGVLVYDVEQSPSTVGYLTDVFRKMSGVKRSLHPFSSVAVWGKDVDYFLEGNIDGSHPLPHGSQSPYGKLAKIGGYSLALGMTARERATIKHVCEDQIEGFPVPDFYETKRVQVSSNGKMIFEKEFPLAKLRFTQVFMSKYTVEKIWENAGCLKRWKIANVPVELVDAKTAVASMHASLKNGTSWYPFANLYRILG